MKLISYMFFKAQFAFFDVEQSAVIVFAEYLAMMILTIRIGGITLYGG